MHYRPFGNDDLTVSEIGLGTWQLGANWGHVEDETAQGILAAAVDGGVTFFDTADVYGKGLSESRIGRFLKTRSEKITVATKVCRYPEPGGSDNYSLEQFRAHTENSIRRLGGEALDLTQVHCPPTDLIRGGELFDWLRALKQEGKIRRFGLSVESMEEALLCLEQEGVASLQIIFNLFRQKPIHELFDRARDKGVAVIVRLPLASGLLSGKFKTETRFPEDDHRNFNRDGIKFNVGETFAGLPFEKGVALAEALKDQAPGGMSLTQLALRWILDFDAVTTIIPGVTTPEQARENCRASSLPPLSRETHAALENFYATRVAEHIRGKY